MENPLAAFGQALGMQPQAHSSNITEAILNEDPTAVARFLSQGASVNNANEDGWTPIQVASWHDKLKALTELLKAQPDLNIQDASGRTAVHLAAFNGSERCLRKLLYAGANPNVTDKHGLTAMHKAAVTGRMPSMRLLLEYKADPACASPDGLTALHLAAWKGQTEVLRLLTSQAGANVQPLSNDGSTPLHEAVRSGESACVELLLQAGADASLADRFGRTPGDLAFAAGNRELFGALYAAAAKAKPAAPPKPEPEEAAVPPPADFWKYLQAAAPKRASSTPPPLPTPEAPAQGQAMAPLSGQPEAAKETHPRKQFEAWLGGVLFPQRHKSSAPESTAGSPYGRVNKVQAPPPSLAAPSFNKIMGSMKGKTSTGPAQHTVGHVGGSTFAAKRAEQAAAAAPIPARPQVEPPMGAVENLTLGLDPYEAAAAPSHAEPGPSRTTAAAAPEPANPLMSMMQALGKKAQKDIQTTMKAAGAAAEDFKKQHALGSKAGVGHVSVGATTGDEEAYDSDEYDESTIAKVQKGAQDDAEDWGEFEDDVDEWGTSASEALTAKKRAQRLAASEGRIYTVQEAREKLEQLDLATAKAQGWLRGKDAHQRLAAMEMLISAYPAQPQAPDVQPPTASAPATPSAEIRTEAGNPFALFTKGLWQQRPHRQEEERLAVQAHLQTSTAAAALRAQASDSKPLPVPEVNFYDAWKATDSFSAENMLLEDAFGKVYRADILGGSHALRVLNSDLYDRPSLDAFLANAARLSHAHLVPLKGACADRGMLLYDLPESGNLLYILQTGVLPTTERLAWNSCVDIALAVASALQYLHNQAEPTAHGFVNAASVYMDRNATSKIGNTGLVQLCDKSAKDTKALLVKDLHALGEIIMQLLTLNTQPIDEGMRKSIIAYIASGQHIHPSDALGWPSSYAEAFEAAARACMEADASTDTAAVLRDAIVPALLNLRGETLQGMLKASSAPAAMARTDGSYLVPASFRCPLTGEAMLDPVRAADGFVYERSAIEQWLKMGRKRSPMTNEALSHPYLIPQQELRSSIETWLRSQNGATKHAVPA